MTLLLLTWGADMGGEGSERAVQHALIHVAALLHRPPANTAEEDDTVDLFKVTYGFFPICFLEATCGG
jgi:hypothetical protein